MDDPNRNASSAGSEDAGTREAHPVSGEGLLAKARELVHEGNVRHLVIKNGEGRTIIEAPLSVGVAGAVLAPMWAAIGAVAALVAHCSIEVEREPEDGGGT